MKTVERTEKIPGSILFVGSVPPPLTGQSFAFNETFRAIGCNRKYLIGHTLENQSGVRKLLAYAMVILKSVFYVLFFRVDIVYFTGSRTLLGGFKDIVLIYLSKIRGVKVVNHLHGSGLKDFFESLPGVLRKIYVRAYQITDVNVVLMEGMANDLYSVLHTDNIAVVPNFYDEKLDHILQREKEVKHAPHILYLSNVIKTKGIFELLDALIICNEKQYSVTLTVAGDFVGDEFLSKEKVKQAFESKIKNIPNARFVGPVFAESKSDLLFSSDIFILPTYYRVEAFPLSILEAMRAGNYIITTDHNFLKTLVGFENGQVIEKQSVDAIVKAIEEIIGNPTRLRQVQTYNMKFAQERYSFPSYIERLQKIFFSLLTVKK